MELNPGEPTAAEILNILGARYRVGPRAGTAKEGCSADGWAEGQGRPDSAAQSSCSSAPPALPQVGYELKDEIERKFDKWQEPPPVKQVKPLPAPLDGQRKKRGGRRYRKMKERLGLTEIRKQANRMSFGEVRPLMTITVESQGPLPT